MNNDVKEYIEQSTEEITLTRIHFESWDFSLLQWVFPKQLTQHQMCSYWVYL